ncbi:MAG: CDP-alcohol phosphatidyltransferase family protein [Oscillospiraceae bacterium]|nr:CDP-alcohol phosphatidyltransferase family protein [Oscillospiraceae bacterium]
MKKHIANIISISRIIAASTLFIFSEITSGFLAIYIYCGFSDLIDGPIARKLGTVSIFGAKMDTMGDVLTYLSLAKILIIQNLIPFWFYIVEGIAFVGFLVSAIISKKKHGKFYFVHSRFGKIMGASMFILPLAIQLINERIYIGIICAISNIAAGESVYIQLKSKNAHSDVVSLKKIED